jgi:glycerol-3-phosphate dehydrogenase
MLHGGIRYLENFDFALVFEALHEKNLWLRLAPHLCYEDSFYMPIFKESKHSLFMTRIGLFLYDFLSSFQNTPFKIANFSQTKEAIPELRDQNLKGAGIYHDVVVDDAKLTFEVIQDGLLSAESRAMNYTSLTKYAKNGENISIETKDSLTGEINVFTCDNIVFAAGPFTDTLLKELNIEWTPQLLPSKGIHLWLDDNALSLKSPMVLQTIDGRIIFVIPQKHAILVGTTETKPAEDFFNIKANESEIQYLLENLNYYFPTAGLTRKNVLSHYAGIRPLVKEGSSSSLGKTSREHKIYQPESSLFVIAGGKLTTFRSMGQQISRMITQKSQKSYNTLLTEKPLRKKSIYPSFNQPKITKEIVLNIIKNEYVRTFDDLVSRRLSIFSKEKFNCDQNFDHFFNSIYPDLEKFIKISKDDIKNF